MKIRFVKRLFWILYAHETSEIRQTRREVIVTKTARLNGSYSFISRLRGTPVWFSLKIFSTNNVNWTKNKLYLSAGFRGTFNANTT